MDPDNRLWPSGTSAGMFLCLHTTAPTTPLFNTPVLFVPLFLKLLPQAANFCACRTQPILDQLPTHMTGQAVIYGLPKEDFYFKTTSGNTTTLSSFGRKDPPADGVALGAGYRVLLYHATFKAKVLQHAYTYKTTFGLGSTFLTSFISFLLRFCVSQKSLLSFSSSQTGY